MHISERTAETLVIEEGSGTRVLFAIVGGIVGVVFVLMGWKNADDTFLMVGILAAVTGAGVFVFGRDHTHRFERGAARVAIDARSLLRSERRELPFASIADIVMERIQGKRSPSYYLYYVTRQGEQIRWCSSYDGSKDDLFECFAAAREFLGLPSTVAHPGELT